jgi:periplasmic copper chaperone A
VRQTAALPRGSQSRSFSRAMKSSFTSIVIGAAMFLATGAARAHVSVASGPGFANATQEIVFGVGHGCAGADTYKVRIQIPANVTSVRPLTSDFGKVTTEKDSAGTITAVTWQKADVNVLDDDSQYYKLTLRARLPDAPFTTVFFPAQQTCKAKDGTMSTTNWTATTPSPDGGVDEPAPEVRLVPSRRPGWNKLKVPAAVTDLARFFGDALIVWKGQAAFSANPTTADLIKATPGVTTLGSLAANDEIWVRY